MRGEKDAVRREAGVCVWALVASVEGGALFTVRNLSGLQLNVQGLYRDTDDIFSYTLEPKKAFSITDDEGTSLFSLSYDPDAPTPLTVEADKSPLYWELVVDSLSRYPLVVKQKRRLIDYFNDALIARTPKTTFQEQLNLKILQAAKNLGVG